jgi:MFS family permease
MVFIACYGIYNLDKSIISIVLEPLKKQFVLNDSQLGLLTGLATTLPFAFTCVPVGLLADRVNRKRLLILLIVIWSAMTGLAGFAQATLFLFMSRMGVGAAEAGFTPVSMSVLSDYFPRRLRATALGTFGLGAPLGILLGLGIGGYVVSVWGWRAAFFIAGIPGLVCAGLLGLTVKEPPRVATPGSPVLVSKPGFWVLVKFIWAEPVLLHTMAGMLLTIVPIAGIAVWLPSFLIRVHGLSIHSAGVLAALIFGVFGSIGAALCSIAADRVGKRREGRKLLVPIIGSALGIACGLSGVLLAPTANWAVAALGPCAFFAQSVIGTGYSLVASLSPTAMRSAAFSVLLVAVNVLSYGLGSQVVGWVSDYFASTHPTRSLAYGLASIFAFSAWGILHFWHAMRLLLRRDAIT